MIQAPGTSPLEWCLSEIQTWSASHLPPRHPLQESLFWTRVERRLKLSELEINLPLKSKSQTRLHMVFLREVVLPWQKIPDPHSPSLMRMDARSTQPYFQGLRPMELLLLASTKPSVSLNHTEWFFNATLNIVSDLVLRYVETNFFYYNFNCNLLALSGKKVNYDLCYSFDKDELPIWAWIIWLMGTSKERGQRETGDRWWWRRTRAWGNPNEA